MKDDLKKNKNEDDIKKKSVLDPLKFRPNLSRDWLSSLRLLLLFIALASAFAWGWHYNCGFFLILTILVDALLKLSVE